MIDLLEWKRRKLAYEEMERADRAGRVNIGDPTPWHAGVAEQVVRDLLSRIEAQDAQIQMLKAKK